MKFLLWFTVLLFDSICGLKNLNVIREVDLDTHVVRIEHKITLDSATKLYKFIIHPIDVAHLSHISVEGGNEKSLTITGTSNEYIIKPDKSTDDFSQFTVITVLTGQLYPKPSEIFQGDTQFMKYSGNAYYYSFYDTNQDVTTINLPTGQLLQFTNSPNPVSKKGENIIYGPYKDVKQKSYTTIDVHYENVGPFLTITKMTRHIEISHWGNIAVEEYVEIRNSGGRLRGPFSRLDFDLGRGRDNAVTDFKTALPAAAKDIYYRDAVGNISTSSIRYLNDAVEVTVQPRFPLMGGWKTEYILGYNVPAHQFLYRKGDQFMLRMRFMDHIYDEQVVEELTVKVVLPEVVSNIHFSVPYSVEQLPNEIIKTYLDTSGRTVLVFNKANLVNEHIQEFELKYQFNMLLMLREPMMLIIGFLVIFAAVLVYMRLDFSILTDEKADLRLRVQAMVDDVQDIYNRRANMYQIYEDMLNGFRSSKNSVQLAKTRRNAEADHKSLNKSLAQMQSKFTDLYNDGVEKITELLNLDSAYRDLIQESMQLSERLVSGKITKQQYQSSDNEVRGKKANLIDRMDTIMENL